MAAADFNPAVRAAAYGRAHRPPSATRHEITAIATVEYVEAPELIRWLGHWLRRVHRVRTKGSSQ